MKKLLLAGFFLLVPLVVLAVLVEKAFEFSLKLTRPLGRFVQIDTLGEMAVANIIAVPAGVPAGRAGGAYDAPFAQA